jgi:hypothetical protein
MIAPLSARQRAALSTVRKTRPTALELSFLADQFTDAVARLEIAGDDENYAAMRAAAARVADFADRINCRTSDLCHAFDIQQGVKP